MLQVAACAATMAFRADAATATCDIHKDLCERGPTPLVVIEVVRYDETPMRARLRDPERQGPGAIIPAVAGISTSPMAVHCVSTHVVKVLQTERLVSLLYALPDRTFLVVKVVMPC